MTCVEEMYTCRSMRVWLCTTILNLECIRDYVGGGEDLETERERAN